MIIPILLLLVVINYIQGRNHICTDNQYNSIKLEDDQELTIGTGNDFVIEHRDTDDNTYITNSTESKLLILVQVIVILTQVTLE